MNKDRIEGKVKDVAGRVERQAGEWTDDGELQAKGVAKQVEGKVQNAWGNAKDAVKKATDNPNRTADDRNTTVEADKEQARRDRKAS
ncbi:MAG TPA: CsbD family protein [Candidatus Sulfotelmatobacter sp.]